jgi:hypothetical protein
MVAGLPLSPFRPWQINVCKSIDKAGKVLPFSGGAFTEATDNKMLIRHGQNGKAVGRKGTGVRAVNARGSAVNARGDVRFVQRDARDLIPCGVH